MNLRYYKCSLSKCHKESTDKCLFQYQARFCLLVRRWFVYKLKYQHLLKYPDAVDRVPCMHPIFKNEIYAKLKENSTMAYTIMKSFIVNRDKISVDLPDLEQIQSYKKRHFKQSDDEAKVVEEFIENHQYRPDISPELCFVAGFNRGIGSSNNHFQIVLKVSLECIGLQRFPLVHLFFTVMEPTNSTEIDFQ